MRGWRWIWLGWLAVAGLGLAVPMGPAGAADAPEKVVRVQLESRKVVVPEKAIRVTEGDTVRLVWSTDEVVEVHLHGYDVKTQVTPGGPVDMVVEAHTSGRFPITSHGWGAAGHGHHALIYLEVYPR